MKLLGTMFFVIMLATSARAGEFLSLYCETGDPSGGGPQVYLDLSESKVVSVTLDINSNQPATGRPNVHIDRDNLDFIKNSETGEVQIPLTRSYQLRLLKSGDGAEWVLRVESPRGRFSAVELSCAE